SSRRRHTRSKRDWSSDVCSSDLKLNLSYTGKKEELDIAIAIINDYVARFSRIMRVKAIVLEMDSRSNNPIKISLDKRINGIYIEENKTPCNARELWYGEKINYRLDTD